MEIRMKKWRLLSVLAGGCVFQFCGCLNPCDLSLPNLCELPSMLLGLFSWCPVCG
jgi:hypothetical protein